MNGKITSGRGFLYICADDDYLGEAQESAKQTSSVMPDVPIGIITDASDPGKVFDVVLDLPDPNHGWADKVQEMHRSPFNKTIFLDTDSYLARPIPEVFELLDSYDILATCAPIREAADVGLSQAFPELSTHILAYQDNKNVTSLFENWRFLYSNIYSDIDADQPVFRRALFKSNATFITLPSEYNVRINIAGYVQQPIAIIHGRSPDPFEAMEKFNQTNGPRIYRPTGNQVCVHETHIDSIIDWILVQYLCGGVQQVLIEIKDALRRRF